METSVAVYGDFQNVYSILEYSKYLPDFGASFGNLLWIKIYYNSQSKNQADAKNKLENSGFKLVDVPCPLKNSADNQLSSDCIADVDNNSSLKIVILFSGDGDFVPLVKILKKLGIKVIVVAQKGNVKQKLREVANEFYFIEQLPELVNKHNQKLSAVDKCKLTYNEAIMCLIETVKTALNKGQGTGIGYINTLMRELFPNYQGVSCISKPTGNNFSKFGDFVKAAVEDGKIRMENQQLFLTE